jgi:hypothetical protein
MDVILFIDLLIERNTNSNPKLHLTLLLSQMNSDVLFVIFD